MAAQATTALSTPPLSARTYDMSYWNQPTKFSISEWGAAIVGESMGDASP
jgi:hypothetical protein